MKAIRPRLTYANVMSSLAVFLVIGGATAIGAKQLGKKTVGTKQLKAKAVTTAKIRNNAVTAKKIKKNAVTTIKIKNDAVTGAKVDEATLGTVPSATSAANLSGHSRKGIVRVVATPGPNRAAAEGASPEIVFYTAGPLTVYAKCFTDTTAGETYGVFYLRTSQNGVIVETYDEYFDGDEGFLNTDTPEDKRDIAELNAMKNAASYWGIHYPEFGAMAPDGTVVSGYVQIAAKNGSLAGGNGIYGDGDVCLFAGEMTVLNG